MADILRLADGVHARGEVLLPWYVNGTLDPAERAFVDGHVVQCERCRTDLARLRTIAEEVRELDVDPDRDLAFGRLSSRIEPVGRLSSRIDSAVSDPLSPRDPIRRRALSSLWGSARALQVLVLLQLGGLAALGAIGLRTVPGAEYRTLAAPAAPSDRGRLIVAFDSAQPEVAIRRVLVAADARVVDGPTADGLYVLEVAAARAAGIVEKLRQSGAVVRVDLAMPAP